MSTITAQPPNLRQPESDEAPLYATPHLQPEFVPSPAPGIFDSHRQAVKLGVKIGAGGQGNVFDVVGKPHLVAKIYHSPPSTEKAKKLIALAAVANEHLAKIAAWPVDVLYDVPQGQVIGFVMHKIALAEEVHALHSPKSRMRKFPEASWAFLIHAATNIARAVAALHKQGFVIGDVNPKNILVTRKGTVYLLDCDSFQCTVEGVTHRCEAGFPDYTPPELQGIAFKDIDRNQEHDSFGLAIVIFQLLFLGRHPYSGRYLGQGEMHLEKAIQELRFAYGDDAAERQMQPPPGTLSWQAIPPDLAALFRRAFLQQDRPNPSEWIEPLETLAQSLTRCTAHNGHLFFQQAPLCPWCSLESQTKIRLFNFQFKSQGTPQNAVVLDSLWQEIKAFKDSTKVGALQLRDLPQPTTSEQALAFSIIRQKSFYLGIGLGFLAALGIGYFLTFPSSLFLLYLAYTYAKTFGKAEALTIDPAANRALSDEAKYLIKLDEKKQGLEQELNALRKRFGNLFEDVDWNRSLRKLDEAYANYSAFMQARASNARLIPEFVRAQKLEAFLQHSRVDDPQIAQFDTELVDWLKSRGLHSAADISNSSIKPLTFIPETRRQSLLDWRTRLESQYLADAKNLISKQEISAAEHKLDDEQREREHDIARRLLYLKQHSAIHDDDRRLVQKNLNKVQKKLAQATHDYETVSKRNSPQPIMVTLIATFLLTSLLTNYFTPPKESTAPITVKAPAPKVANNPSSNVPARYDDEAMRLYNEGIVFSKAGHLQFAADSLKKAIAADKLFYGAYNELGYVYYKLHNYKLALATVKAVGDFKDFDTYGIQALVYAGQKKWELARKNADLAMDRMDAKYWYPHFPEVCYARNLADVRLGQAGDIIKSLEARIPLSDSIPEDRFQLATYYLAQGHVAKAEALLPELMNTHRDLGEGLERLIATAKIK